MSSRFLPGKSLWLGLMQKDDEGAPLEPGRRNVRIASCSFTPDGARKVADKIRALADEADRELELPAADAR